MEHRDQARLDSGNDRHIFSRYPESEILGCEIAFSHFNEQCLVEHYSWRIDIEGLVSDLQNYHLIYSERNNYVTCLLVEDLVLGDLEN